MKTPSTNLCVLKKSWRAPEVGDIFVFKLLQIPDRYFFGRVIATDTTIGNIQEIGVILIYLYNVSSPNKMEIPALKTFDLLVPPIGSNRQPWLKGYFEVVKSSPLLNEDVLPQHCFRDSRGWFFDEYSNRLPCPVEPVSSYGLSGVGSIDREISKAVGIPLKNGD